MVPWVSANRVICTLQKSCGSRWILPLVIEIVDSEEKINAFLPVLEEMMGGGLVTLEKAKGDSLSAQRAAREEN